MLKIYIIITIIFISLLSVELPEYTKKIIYNLNLSEYEEIFKNWSFVETTHLKNFPDNDAYGRYGIRPIWLKDYCRYNNLDYKKIKNIKKYLSNDYNNCYIAYWTVRFWLDMGFNIREVFQIWLWGMRNVYEKNRWSYDYERKIFGNTDRFCIKNKSLYKQISQ